MKCSPSLLIVAVAAAVLSAPEPAPAARALRQGEVHLSPSGGFVVTGRAIDPIAEGPAAGVRLGLFRRSLSATTPPPEPWVLSPADRDQLVAELTSRPDGRFTARGLPAGGYEIRPISPSIHSTNPGFTLGPSRPRASPLIEIEVGVRLQGRVVSSSGKALAGFEVEAVAFQADDGGNQWVGNHPRPATRSGPDGGFDLGPLPTGQVTVQSWRRGVGYSEPHTMVLLSGRAEPELLITVPDERKLLSGTRENTGGIGVSLHFTRDGPRIRRVLPGMAAEAAGMKAGDLIVEVGGRATATMTAGEFLDRCRGPAGEAVQLTIRRDDERRNFRLTRRFFERERNP